MLLVTMFALFIRSGIYVAKAFFRALEIELGRALATPIVLHPQAPATSPSNNEAHDGDSDSHSDQGNYDSDSSDSSNGGEEDGDNEGDSDGSSDTDRGSEQGHPMAGPYYVVAVDGTVGVFQNWCVALSLKYLIIYLHYLITASKSVTNRRIPYPAG